MNAVRKSSLPERGEPGFAFQGVQFLAFSFPLLSTHGLAVDDFASGALPKLRVPGGTSDVGFMQRILKVSGER